MGFIRPGCGPIDEMPCEPHADDHGDDEDIHFQIAESHCSYCWPNAKAGQAPPKTKDCRTADQPGIHHQGFVGESLVELATAAGFEDAQVRIVHELERDGRTYPLFLLTGHRAEA